MSSDAWFDDPRRVRACYEVGPSPAGGVDWTGKHQAWIAGQRFDDSALTATFGHCRGPP